MTNIEFSTAFDTLLNSYSIQTPFGGQSNPVNIVLDEYEKSVFLTKAQMDIVINLYSGRNIQGLSFENTEEARRYLNNLVEDKVYYKDDFITPALPFSKEFTNSVRTLLPDNLLFITFEQVVLDDETLGCYNGSVANVYPVTQDEYAKVRKNPFRGPTKYKVLRLDTGAEEKQHKVDLVTKYAIGAYCVKYIRKPKPIVLVNLPQPLEIDGETNISECEMDASLHDLILKQAVAYALASRQSVSSQK